MQEIYKQRRSPFVRAPPARQWTPTAAAAAAPQGAVISPLLSNIYLDALDHLMERLGFEMVRYADDFVVLYRGEPKARAALDAVRQWTAQAGLALHPDKTRVVDAAREDFEFLGYRFSRGRKFPRDKSRAKLKDAVRGPPPGGPAARASAGSSRA